jgi:heat shock protein HslJ
MRIAFAAIVLAMTVLGCSARHHESVLPALTTSDSPLRGTYWKLVQLGGMPVQAADRQREPHLIFATAQPRVSGSGGCNRVVGPFEFNGEKLRVPRMASTRMACSAGMEQEQQFLRLIEKVQRYRISGRHLEMLDAESVVIAKFEAVPLR